MLMRAYKSVPTWTTQLQAPVQAKNQLVGLKAEMQDISRSKAAAEIGNAIGTIDALESEYEREHARLTIVQSRFENTHANHPPESKVRDLPRHWEEVLGSLDTLKRVLARDDSALLAPLRSAIRFMRK